MREHFDAVFVNGLAQALDYGDAALAGLYAALDHIDRVVDHGRDEPAETAAQEGDPGGRILLVVAKAAADAALYLVDNGEAQCHG
eukprot:6204015-Pleurochrysis_carterae.AAC.1